jgi:UDP-2-acetamido-2-deoxy-ribo-hexuluronate aminotransferase
MTTATKQKHQSMSISFVDLKLQYRALKPAIDARIQAVLDHCQFIMGPEVKELEDRLAPLVGVKHCITVASGTEALLISLMALNVKPGDEVITTPFSFIATAEAIVLLGAKPVFVDIEPDTCNLDPSRIEQMITAKTRAIMPVSLYGQPCDMDEINDIAARHGLTVIEDAAQSFGAEYKGRKSCNLSSIGCTSFFPSKPLGCYGDGGAIFVGDDSLANAMREIRVHGQSQRYLHTRVGLGGRMDTLQCAVVLAKLERFEWEIGQRQEVAERYNRLLSELPESVQRVLVRSDRTSAFAQFTVLVPDRDRVQKRLSAAGVPTAVHYPIPMHCQPAYEGRCSAADLSVSERLSERVLSLPMYADLDHARQDRIVAELKQAVAAG